MAKKKGNSVALPVAIVAAGLLVGGGIAFSGVLGNNTDELKEIMEEVVDGKLSGEQFEQKVIAGIDAYIENQERAYEEQVAASQPKLPEDGLLDDDPFLGDEDAPVVVYEFSDYQCPACHIFYKNTLEEFKKEYVETGKAKLVYKDLPLMSIHPDALPAANFANCYRAQTDDEGYFAAHDFLFELFIAKEDFNTDSLVAFAEKNGLDGGEIRSCQEEMRYEDEVMGDYNAAAALGISSTPSFFVGDSFAEGALSFSSLSALIDEQL